MLRHKSLIQCSRYAFGFAGIYDEDEGRAIIDAQEKEPVRQPPRPNVPVEVEDLGHREEPKDGKIDRGQPVDDIGFGSSPEQPAHDAETGEIIENTQGEEAKGKGESTSGNVPQESTPAAEEVSAGEMLEGFDTEAQTATTELEVQEIWNKHDLMARFQSARRAPSSSASRAA
jgi:hypothetical protein